MLDDKSKVVANLPAVTAVSAIWFVPIPEALTCKESPDTSIVVSSTAVSYTHLRAHET